MVACGLRAARSARVNSGVRNGGWYILRSSQGFIGIQFGEAADRPVPADYDGDGRADVACLDRVMERGI